MAFMSIHVFTKAVFLVFLCLSILYESNLYLTILTYNIPGFQIPKHPTNPIIYATPRRPTAPARQGNAND